MATFLQGESRRMYSWWWDSHISPKNSKWLQENLTDMDRNIKAMIKLIEEDADSFARRAEMYYKKRPELMKMVEEFYRAYRALAERYNHATGALRQAHRTMTEAFPNQIPPILPDDSPAVEIGPHTPEMPSPMRALADVDDLQEDALGLSSHFHARRKSGAYNEENILLSSKKGLKQLKEMFPPGEGKVRKVLNFKEEQGIVAEKEDLNNEIKRLQEEVAKLSITNRNLSSLMESESQRAHALEETIFKLESTKEVSLLRHKHSIERISTLETDISNSMGALHKVNDEMAVKLSSVEEQCLAMEKANKSVQLDLVTQHHELEKKARELEELNTIIEEEQQKRMLAEVALASLEQIHTHSQEEAELLISEIHCGNEKLKDMELSKVGLEEKISELNEIIGNLHDENKSFNIKINDLQDEMKLLQETKYRLENELLISFEETKNLQKELCCLKEDQKDLEESHQGLTEQMKVILERNMLLENSLSDANVELEGLRERANALEASCESLLGEVSNHVVEKGVLASKIEIISQEMGWFTERNTFLENSVSDANAELEGSRVRFKDLEERCMCLCDQNSALLAENSILVSQVDSLGSKYLELQDQHSNLDREKDSTVQQVIELQSSLRIEKHNHEALIMSLTSQLASLQKQIHLLEEEIQFKVTDFEMEQEKVMSSLFEIFILQRCLCDMKDSNLSLFGEYQNLLEASRCMENQISQFKHKELIQKKEIASLLDQKEALSKGIHLLLEELNVDVKDSIGDEVLAQIILGETKILLLSISNVRDENQQLHLKVLNLESTYSALHEHCNSLERDKDSAVHQVMALESLLSLQKQDQEALTLSFLSQLASSQKQVYFLQEEIRARDVDLEMKQQKTINADLENFVLQRCLCDVQDRNLILSVNCQNLLEALRSAENQISQLELKALIQKKEMASLLAHNEVLSKDIHLLLEELNVDDKDDITDEVRLQIILGEVKNLLISIFDARDENQQLYVKVLNLESKCLTLQDHHNYLEREKDSIIHKVTELENFLSLQKQEHEALTLSFSGQLASLRNEIHLLQEGIHVRDVDLETEQQKTINADIEFFVLKRCICDMCDKNLSLSVECQNILEALRCTENQISQLEHKDTMQKRELTLLSNHSEILRAGMHQLLQGLHIDVNNRIKDDPTDEILLQTIVGEIRDLMSSVSDANDENQCLRLELLVLNTLFKQTGFDKFHLHHELDRRTEELLALERAKQDLIKMNKQLKGENNFFVSQVENIRQSLELLEAKYSELEEKTLHLEREKYSAFHRVLELECSLKLEKQEHHTLLLSSNTQLASLETQLDLLKKERLVKEDEFEIEQQNTMRALLENFILQRSLHDMRDSNSLLSGECQKLQFACLIQQNEIMLTSENNKNLRSGILLLLKELNINNKCGTVDETKDEALLQTLQHEIETLMNYISNCEVEMQHLHIEMSVLVTLLKHIGLEKSHLYCELASHHEELLSVRNCKDLAIQILSEELSDLHVTHQRLQTEMCKLLEENHSLSRRISDLMKKMDALEGENGNVLAEALTVDHLFIFFKSLSVERGLKLKLLSDGILAAKNGRDEEIRVQNNIKKVLEVENMNLMELAVLQEFDLNVTRNFCEEFHQQLEAEEKSLIQMKLEISDAREENTELYRKLEGLNKDLDCANVITKVLEKEIETLSSDIASKDEKIIEVLETNSLLRIELDILNCEVQAHRRMEDFLSLELRKSSSEACKCEGEIQTLLDDAHISTVNAAILEEKVIGLMVECETHETLSILQRERLGDEIDFKNACIDVMKKELDGLKKQNGSLKAELNAYSSLLISLFDGVACVEEHICSLAQFQETMEDDISRTPSYVKSSHQPSEKEKLSDLQNLIVKIESLQKVMVDTKNLLKQERLDSNAKMESAMKEIEELKQRERLLKEISREKYVQTMKDIQLDQMSNSGINFSKMNRNENAESDDQMLELWEETSERNDAIEVEEEVKSEYPSRDLGIDKLEVSTRVDESPREWNKRFNEKLDSDAQRLSLIQRSLQELKTRLEGSEKKKQLDNWEYGTLKMQMREAEEAILQQVDINGKLKKEVEDNFESSNERRQISEQTRKGSEKIGKLELELQKMEYIFLKVQEENEDKKNVRVERKSSILLSEYIYGKKDGKGRRRKGRICGCMRPKTKN